MLRYKRLTSFGHRDFGFVIYLIFEICYLDI